LKFPVSFKLPTEKPASSTAFFKASISTWASLLKTMSKEEFLTEQEFQIK